MQKACDGGIAAALSEMHDECLDRVRIDSCFRRRLKTYRIVTIQKSQIPRVGGAKAHHRSRSQVSRRVFVVERVLLEGAEPQVAVGERPVFESQVLSSGQRHQSFPFLSFGLFGLDGRLERE